MKVMLLTRHERLGPSSRLRYYQYLPYLAKQGIEVESFPLFDAMYLNCLYSGLPRPVLSIAKAYYRRINQLVLSRSYDLIWLESEALPWFPVWMENFGVLKKIPYVVDYDDAIFHRYDRNPLAIVRVLLRHKIDRIMQHARLVITGNSYLKKRAQRAGAVWVESLPTVVDLTRYRLKMNDDSSVFTIGWIGSPTTAAYVKYVYPAIDRLCKKIELRMVMIGGYPETLPTRAPVEFHQWSEESEVGHILQFDIGIMPIPDSPWACGKCGYKLIQYMACGLPVVASSVGANTQIVQNGITGFLVSTEEDWEQALSLLNDHKSLRQNMGQAGRKRVESHYSLQVTAQQLATWLHQAAYPPDR